MTAMSEIPLANVEFPAPIKLLREKPSGVRILTPTGEVAYVPQERLTEALADGATLLTVEKMRDMRQAIFMEHALHLDKTKKPPASRHEARRKRKSFWRGGR